MRIVYYRIYLLFLLASLAMLTHFSALCCLNRQLGSFALCGGRPRALPYGTRKPLKRLDLNFIPCYSLLFLSFSAHIFNYFFLCMVFRQHYDKQYHNACHT